MEAIQKAIHSLEVGGGMKFLRIGLIPLALLLCAVLYDWREYKNMSSLEGMDAAQVARNLEAAAGDGIEQLRAAAVHHRLPLYSTLDAAAVAIAAANRFAASRP